MRIGVVGATGAVGRVTLELLRERGHESVRAFASSRSAGTRLGELVVEEATPDALGAGDLDVCLFSVGASASRELVPHAVRGGALCIDKSSAFRLDDGVPLVVPEVNGERAAEHSGILANPNCCSIPLTMVLAPLRRRRRATQRARRDVSVGRGGRARRRCSDCARRRSRTHDLRMDWDFDGLEFDEESKIRAETRKILELPDLPVSATCVRVPVLVGHAEALWVETEEPLEADERGATARRCAGPATRSRSPRLSARTGLDEVLVGRIRRDSAAENGLALFLACDNLRKGAASERDSDRRARARESRSGLARSNRGFSRAAPARAPAGTRP